VINGKIEWMNGINERIKGVIYVQYVGMLIIAIAILRNAKTTYTKANPYHARTMTTAIHCTHQTGEGKQRDGYGAGGPAGGRGGPAGAWHRLAGDRGRARPGRAGRGHDPERML
jgi:hypothetical protein